MNRESLYKADDDDDDDDDNDDDIHEDLEDLRRACMVSEANRADGGCIPLDSEKEDEFEMLRSIKSQLATNVDLCGTHPPMVPSDSENEDDLEILRSIKSQLGSSTDVDLCGTNPPLGDSESEDDLEMLRSIKSQLALPMNEDDDTLRAICRRFSAYENSDLEGNFMKGKRKQVHASDNELSRSNTCEIEELEADDSVENTSIDHCETSLIPATSSSSTTFPESAQAFVDAIRRNRSYQKFLRQKLGEIEATIEQNEKHKKNVMIVKDFQATCKRMTKQALSQRKDPRIELISTRKSQPSDDGNGKKTSPLTLGPPENPCVANYRMALKEYPVSIRRAKWSTKENENLAKGLKQQLQETLILEATERSLEGCTDTILESIRNLKITPEMIRQFLPKVNWDKLDIKNRSAAECEARWMSSEDPLINHGPWTREEDDYIRLTTQNKSFKDWLDIAVSLGTNRTPFQCLARYQRSLNPDILSREWTPEEDEKLRDAVGLFGEKDWQSVASVLKGRIGTQCSNRWKKSIHPTIETKGNWSSVEEKRLKVAVTLFGAKTWSKIAKFVPGRTQSQCSEKWRGCLNPKLKSGKWSEEEIAKLSEAIKEHGYSNWSKVAAHVSSRTGKQCSRRWYSLNPHLLPLKKEAIRLRREATVGNFVDRESERTYLVASHFLALAEEEPALKISLEPEPALKKKRKARCTGDVCRRENETEDNVMLKEKKQRRKRKSVAGTSNNSSLSAVVAIEKENAL